MSTMSLVFPSNGTGSLYKSIMSQMRVTEGQQEVQVLIWMILLNTNLSSFLYTLSREQRTPLDQMCKVKLEKRTHLQTVALMGLFLSFPKTEGVTFRKHSTFILQSREKQLISEWSPF